MSAVVATSAARQMNWCGKGTKGKVAFGGTKVAAVVYSKFY
jgi:hypothetical protein